VSPRAVLIGLPGTGKTTTGRSLAARLGVSFADSDQLVESHAGCSVREIFETSGEPAFRRAEADAIAAALESFGGVLALGGGAILAEQNRAELVGHTVVYLSVELSDAVRRVGLGQGRPLLALNPRATLKYLLEQRRPLYEKAATITVVTDGRTVEEVAEKVLAALKGHGDE
jgi:shikimate kinase